MVAVLEVNYYIMFIERFIPKKILRLLFILGGCWLIVGVVMYGLFPSIVGRNSFIESEFQSVIDSIEYRPQHRGAPSIKLRSGWHLIRIEEMKIVNFIQVKDSIAKERGSEVIRVYRRVEKGELKPYSLVATQ